MSEKITPEFAEAEFERFAESMDLDVDPKGMDDDDRKSLDAGKRALVRALVDGNLVVNEQGEAIVVLRSEVDGIKQVKFPEPKGAAFLARDQKKTGHDVAKQFATMAEITGVPQQVFAKMLNRDVKLCLAVTLLFLG
jgi:hypothetical protein